ncbi:MAG: helix-turn-helix transcriptional regulator [Planctomycetaceae bacterium]
MIIQRKRNLECADWKVGTVQEFLRLSDEESELIELRLALAWGLKNRRVEKNMTQHELAKLLDTSQSRVAKMEAADISVSIDLIVKSLLKLGVTRRELGRIIGGKISSPAA